MDFRTELISAKGKTMGVSPRLLILAFLVLAANIAVADENPSEYSAIAKIESLGGKVKKDISQVSQPVIEVDFKRSKKFDDTSLVLLKPFRHLKRLNVSDTEITNAGMKEIGKFNGLTTLYINKTQISNADLKELRKLEKLEALHVIGIGVTDEGLKTISELTSLTTLHLGRTEVTENGLKELKKLRHLTELNLINTNVNDAGLKELSDISSLVTLLLGRNEITDSGLAELSHLKNLKVFSYAQNKTTTEGEAALKQALPDLIISKTTKVPNGSVEVRTGGPDDLEMLLNDKNLDKVLNDLERGVSKGEKP